MRVAAYIHGNLAVEQKSEQKPKAGESKQRAPHRRSLPMQEKLLYLFTVAVCVTVACAVIWRYAQIYQINAEIHRIEGKISQLEAENSSLKQEISKLQNPQRLVDEAKKRGFVPVADNQISRISAKPDASDQEKKVAIKP